jgi:hypothetical protein
MNTQVKGRIRRIEIDEVTVLSRYSTPTSIQTRAIVRALQFYFLSFACPRTRDLLSIALSPKPFRHISVIVVSSIFFMAFHCLRVYKSDPFRTRAGAGEGLPVPKVKTPIRLKTSSPLFNAPHRETILFNPAIVKMGLEERHPIGILDG